jgi:anti-sigma-K factor RskA
VRYDQPQTREALAAEYVMGSLRGPARRRFERLMAQRADWRDEVELWSTQLAGLAATVPAVEPPSAVWQRIESRLGSSRAPVAVRGLRWWKTFAAVASIASIALAIALVSLIEEPAVGPQVSVLKDPQARTGWVVTYATGKSGRPELRVVVESAAAIADRAFELWALPAGAAPVSLGLLPAQGEAVLAVSPQARTLLERGAGLAVSVEPPGGSPTGQPTGPVVYQGRLIAL